jgi:ABC-2 type transport system permease protein
MNGFFGGALLQLATFRRGFDNFLALITVPMFTIAFLAITRHAGRPDLAAYAVLAPAVVLTSGEVIAHDRNIGTVELALAAPTPLQLVVLGRVAVVTLVSLIGVLEAWLVAKLLFGLSVLVSHVGAFIGAVALTVLAMAGTALLMAALFVAARSARTFQNTISYPLYLLGGAFVPTALLPSWLHPLSRVIFLSWSTDLMRDCFAVEPLHNYCWGSSLMWPAI